MPGAQPLAVRPWRPAGEKDESHFDRPLTDAELREQERAARADAEAARQAEQAAETRAI